MFKASKKLVPMKNLKKLSKDPLVSCIIKSRKTFIDHQADEFHKILYSIGVNPKHFRVIKK